MKDISSGIDVMTEAGSWKIGIYVRESRDENGENLDTIETQRDMLIDHVQRLRLGMVTGIYMDDNVSGSRFSRPGLERLKKDAGAGIINMVLLKDLSRLGRNNAKTLLFLDYLEESGIRVMTYDGKYDSLKDNDTVGIETWVNERYVRDLSKKIRASLRFKISKGEYIGHAPFGYRKRKDGSNSLVVNEEEAETVRLIFNLYCGGYGYTSIAEMLNGKQLKAPAGYAWNPVAIGRIIRNRVYIGDTVQGVSERVSFKSKKVRLLPAENWTITENTHEAIVDPEIFIRAQKIRTDKNGSHAPHKDKLHSLRGLVYCGGCGSTMYARTRRNSTIAYVCGNYFKNGISACTSHIIFENELLEYISDEIGRLFNKLEKEGQFSMLMEPDSFLNSDAGERIKKLRTQLTAKFRQQKLAYEDRLEGRITAELFDSINAGLENMIRAMKEEIAALEPVTLPVEEAEAGAGELIQDLAQWIRTGQVTNAVMRMCVKDITVSDKAVVVDFNFKLD
jgi:DNA invertase Pin-like site-specific DNA recombinase